MIIKYLTLFLLFLIAACLQNESITKAPHQTSPESAESPNVAKPSIHKQSPEPLIINDKINVFKEAGIELISVLSPRQETYDCWMHAPFNAWRLLQGDTPEDFAGGKWEEKLREEIIAIKKELGIKGTRKGDQHECINTSKILNELLKNEDIKEIVDLTFYYDIDRKEITKANYDYFTNNKEGKKIAENLKEVRRAFRRKNITNKTAYIQLIKDKIQGIESTDTDLKQAANQFYLSSPINLSQLEELVAYLNYKQAVL